MADGERGSLPRRVPPAGSRLCGVPPVAVPGGTPEAAAVIELADDRGYKVKAPRDSAQRGGTVAVDVPHGYEVAQHLLSRDILVDYRVGAGIRIAPHFFTKDEELEEAVAEIDVALETGSWQRFAEKSVVVT